MPSFGMPLLTSVGVIRSVLLVALVFGVTAYGISVQLSKAPY